MAPARVLVVANRTAATPRLLDAVRERAAQGTCEFFLLVPPGADGDWTPEEAARLLERSAHGPVAVLAPGPDAAAAVEEAVRSGRADEIVVSVKPPRASRWLRRDLVHRLERLGVPVTAVVPGVRRLTREERLEDAGRFSAGGG